ncbi:thioredoxin family protein [Photobacterium sagamiensis]|uniref:protein-disulfide reductase DsbD family protein n=1 Tax=Photobacterium sagamiensis TaxID=2910241 RepID=UPI003D0D2917
MKKLFTPFVALFILMSSLLTTLTPFSVHAAGVADFVTTSSDNKSYSTGWLINPQHPPLEVRLMLTGQNDLQAKTVEGLLEVILDADWKTYWRSPGESGIAPTIDWSLSNNLNNVDWQWPLPKRYEFLGVETLGYKTHAIFPLTFHIDDMNKPAFLSGMLTMSSCTNVCVLTDYELNLDFTPTNLTPAADNLHLYNQGMSQVPKSSPTVSLEQLSWDEAKQTVTVLATNTMGWQSPDVFIDGNSTKVKDTSFLTPDITVNGNQLIATLGVTSWFGKPDLLNEPLNITVGDSNVAVELTGTTTNQPVAINAGTPLFKMIAFALLGGLILNIMPCVLPVLGMKLSSIIATEGMAKRQIRRQFLASATGILTSFWLLAGFLMLLKLSGQALGWGIQFQNPYFIGAMILITGLFAANMLGLLEIRLSSDTNTWLATRGDNSYTGHFIQGMFATLLATPCSAPFLGTAVAFALGADYITLLAVFTALAMGMAAPWLLIAIFPQLATLLPKPGAWMDKVKNLFGLMMLATSLWLLSLMSNFLSTMTIWLVGICLIVLLLWRLGTVKGGKPVIITIALLFLGSATGLILGSVTADRWSTPLPADLPWQQLNVAAIKQAVDDGNTVFVDVTADWCITCKANKIGVLLRQPVYSQLQADNIVRMRGDWTKPSDYVTGFLQTNGRFGVPFNIVYGPAAPQGIPLPVILTREEVAQALRIADGSTSIAGK